MAAMPVWVLFLVLSLILVWVAASLLSAVNPGEVIPWAGAPPVLPTSFVFIFGAGVACAWLAGSYASEGVLGPWGYPLGALSVLIPWVLVRYRHNRVSR